MNVAEAIGRLKAAGGNPKVPGYLKDILQAIQRSPLDMVDLRNIPVPPKEDASQTEDRLHYCSLPITPFSMEVSGMNGDHWDRMISRI
jgi:hypothetical protein